MADAVLTVSAAAGADCGLAVIFGVAWRRSNKPGAAGAWKSVAGLGVATGVTPAGRAPTATVGMPVAVGALTSLMLFLVTAGAPNA